MECERRLGAVEPRDRWRADKENEQRNSNVAACTWNGIELCSGVGLLGEGFTDLAEIWVACRESMQHLQNSNPKLSAKLQAILHKQGQL